MPHAPTTEVGSCALQTMRKPRRPCQALSRAVELLHFPIVSRCKITGAYNLDENHPRRVAIYNYGDSSTLWVGHIHVLSQNNSKQLSYCVEASGLPRCHYAAWTTRNMLRLANRLHLPSSELGSPLPSEGLSRLLPSKLGGDQLHHCRSSGVTQCAQTISLYKLNEGEGAS